MSRSTVENTIERIRRQLSSSVRTELNELAVSTTADAAERVLTMSFDISNIASGTILSIGRELCRVIAVDPGPKEVTVRRAWQDSWLEAHDVDDEVMISPRFTRLDIYDALIAEIESWAPRLFRVVTYEWTTTDSMQSIEVPATYTKALGVVSLRRQWSDQTDSNAWPTIDYRTMRGQSGVWSAASLSGLMIRLLPNMGVLKAGTVVAQLAIPFDVSSDDLLLDEDLVTEYGLEYSMLDLVDLGVKIRLMGDDETGRTARDAQDEPRRAEENPPGSSLTLAQTWRNNYTRRFGDEARKLTNRYPMSAW